MAVTVLSVLVSAAARTGGPPAFTGEAALALPAFGAKMRIFATDLTLAPAGWWQRQRRLAAHELHPALARADLTVFPARFPRRLAFSPGLSEGLREALRRCDVVHIHNLWQYPQYATYRTAERFGVPYIVSPHGGLDPYLRKHGPLRKALTSLVWQGRMLENAALIHVTTKAEGELIADIAPHVPRTIVPCGIHTSEFSRLPPRDQFRRTHLAGYEGPLILFLSRLSYKKGLDALVRAFARARRTLECRLVIVGPDDEGLRPSLQNLASDLGVGRDVSFPGPLYGEERLAALASTDLWALSSYTENFGIAVVEAMAAGCAVVVSPAVNLAQDIVHADAGAVASPTPERFGEALVQLLSDDARRAQLRLRAPEFAARYDWRVVAPQLAAIYREAASLGT